MMGGGSDWLVALQGRLMRSELEKLKVRSTETPPAKTRPTRENVAAKLATNAALTREEVALHLEVSTKKIQRMERAGKLRRCPELAPLVRYAADDVRRLASAQGKER
jgi:hypothetical protein